MSIKEFKAAKAEIQQEPIQVDLGDGDIFPVNLPLPGMAILDVASAAEDQGLQTVTAMTTFLKDAMGEETYKEFHKKCMEKRLSIETIAEIMSWIIEEATGRPTQQPSDLLQPQSHVGRLSPIAASN